MREPILTKSKRPGEIPAFCIGKYINKTPTKTALISAYKKTGSLHKVSSRYGLVVLGAVGVLQILL